MGGVKCRENYAMSFEKAVVVDWELSAAGTDDVFLGLFQPDYPQLLLIQVRLLLGS